MSLTCTIRKNLYWKATTDITAMDLSAPLHWHQAKRVPQMVQAAHSPLDRVADAHPKLSGACLHAPADHQPVAGLEDVQRTGHCGIGHGAHKYGNILI